MATAITTTIGRFLFDDFHPSHLSIRYWRTTHTHTQSSNKLSLDCFRPKKHLFYFNPCLHYFHVKLANFFPNFGTAWMSISQTFLSANSNLPRKKTCNCIKALMYKNAARNMFVKLTPTVSATSNLHMHFSCCNALSQDKFV